MGKCLYKRSHLQCTYRVFALLSVALGTNSAMGYYFLIKLLSMSIDNKMNQEDKYFKCFQCTPKNILLNFSRDQIGNRMLVFVFKLKAPHAHFSTLKTILSLNLHLQ